MRRATINGGVRDFRRPADRDAEIEAEKAANLDCQDTVIRDPSLDSLARLRHPLQDCPRQEIVDPLGRNIERKCNQLGAIAPSRKISSILRIMIHLAAYGCA